MSTILLVDDTNITATHELLKDVSAKMTITKSSKGMMPTKQIKSEQQQNSNIVFSLRNLDHLVNLDS